MNPLSVPLVDVLHRLRTRTEQRDEWRLVALAAIAELTKLSRELEMTSRNRHTYQKHVNAMKRAAARAYEKETAA